MYACDSEEDVRNVLTDYRADKDLQKEIAKINTDIILHMDHKDVPEQTPPFVAETMIGLDNSIEYC